MIDREILGLPWEDAQALLRRQGITHVELAYTGRPGSRWRVARVRNNETIQITLAAYHAGLDRNS